MKKGEEMKRRYFCRTKAGWLTLCALLLSAVLLSLRFGSAGMDWPSFWGGLLRREGFETQSMILFALRLQTAAGDLCRRRPFRVRRPAPERYRQRSSASRRQYHRRKRRGRLCSDHHFELFPNAVMGLPFAAFLGAFLTTLLIMAIANRVDSSKATVILAGIAVQALLSAGISFFSLLDTDVLVSYTYFPSAVCPTPISVSYGSPEGLILLGLAVSLAFSGRIQLLCLGDGMALSLGVRVKQVRMLCLVCASACAAAVVSFAGLLGFVGLIVPHIARKLVGARTRPLLAVSAVTGSILVLTADFVGRVAFAPSEVPVGIVMSLIGAPFFFLLLMRRRARSC